MKVKVYVSARHVHLNNDDYNVLFGNVKLEKIKDLTQPGEYASNLYVDVLTDKGQLNHVRLIGPIRNYTQLEISKTDAYVLGIDPPVRNSGDLSGASSVTLIGPNGSIKKECAIIANRHIHIKNSEVEKLGLSKNKTVKLLLSGEKGGIIDNVYLKISDNYNYEAHIDLDDANSHLLKNGDMAEIIL